MVTQIGMQVLIFAALALAMFLVGYTIYVRVRQETYTEKRFNFVALWSCSAVVFLAVHVLTDLPLVDSLLAEAGLSFSPPDKTSKLMVTLLAGYYVWLVMGWAKSWNGLISEDRSKRQNPGKGDATLYFS